MADSKREKMHMVERMRQSGTVADALRGDMRPLIALLRSDKPLAQETREYLAQELENPPKQRFVRRSRENPAIVKHDRKVIDTLDFAKFFISHESGGAVRPWEVTDAEAIRRLSDDGIGWVDESAVNNARRRGKARGRPIIEYANGKGYLEGEQ